MVLAASPVTVAPVDVPLVMVAAVVAPDTAARDPVAELKAATQPLSSFAAVFEKAP